MKDYQIKSPVLITVFNRPDNLERRLNQVLKYQPPEVYVAVDGPRKDNLNDKEAHKRILEILRTFEHQDSMRTQVQPVNLGARQGMIAALSWFFENVAEGVIIEDDIDFSPGFFPYVDFLLEKYRFQPEIGGINGWNPVQLSHIDSNSYFFSKYPFIYGWGAWRRTWRQYLEDLTSPLSKLDFTQTPLLSRAHAKKIDRYFKLKFAGVEAGHIDTWDFSLCYSAWKNGLLYVCPARSQTKNIGLESSRVRRFRQQIQSPTPLATTYINTPDMSFSDLDVDDLFDEVVFGFKAHSNNAFRLLQVWTRAQLEKIQRGRRILK